MIETESVSTTQDHRSAARGTQGLSGADILVEALIQQGVDHIFAYPGGASMPLHQALIHNAKALCWTHGGASPNTRDIFSVAV